MAEQEQKTSYWGGLARKLWQGTKCFVSALILPIDLKFRDKETRKWSFSVNLNPLKVAIFTVAYYIVQPLSVFLFPTAEQVLKREGLDPKIIENITPVKDIRVVPDNFAGKTYFLFSNPPVLSPAYFISVVKSLFGENIRGFETDGDPGFLVRLISKDLSAIFLKSNAAYIDKSNGEIRRDMEAVSEGLYTYVPTSTGKDFEQRVLLHEIRHTSPENDKLTPMLREADADYYAFQQLALARHDPALVQGMFYDDLVMGKDADHNDALYLYFKFNKQAVPGERELRQANADAEPVINDYAALYGAMIGGKTEAVDSLSQKFNAEMAQLSPLAALRVRLFQDALQRHIVPKTPALKPNS
ncbi:MAG: hypothetical protein K8R48_06335 [Alphaproteobacteria bacterium]|nr:hypothetical protein [Alphaproteobacteria bacterium]